MYQTGVCRYNSITPVNFNRRYNSITPVNFNRYTYKK